MLFVVDAMIGQDAVNTAQAFLDGVGYDGVVLTKLDGDARGGAALSIAKMTGKPVMFASNGEKLTDFDLFHPDRMASRILDMGDLLTLIEQAEKTFDAEQAAKAAAKLQGDGEFTLDDFLEQMQQVRKMGSLTKMLGMLPGMGQFRDQLENFDEREIDRIQAIIQSMTPAERANPKMIDGSRRARIAKGSGRQVSDVNQLVDRFFEARKMMQQMARGGAPGMPGAPGMGLGKKAKGRQAAAAEEGQGQAPVRQPGQARPGGGCSRGEAGRRVRRRRSASARTRPSRTTSTRASCRTSPSTSSSPQSIRGAWPRLVRDELRCASERPPHAMSTSVDCSTCFRPSIPGRKLRGPSRGPRRAPRLGPPGIGGGSGACLGRLLARLPGGAADEPRGHAGPGGGAGEARPNDHARSAATSRVTM